MLQELGHGWHPADPILGADGQPVAAIWRDSDGNVFLPFDPGEVMQQFWSEEYRRRRALGPDRHRPRRRRCAATTWCGPCCHARFSCSCGVSSPGCRQIVVPGMAD